MFPLQGTQNLPPIVMTSTQIPQPPSRSSFLCLGETLTSMQHYYMPSFPGGSLQFLPEVPQTSPSMALSNLQTTEPPPRTQESGGSLFAPKEYVQPTLPGCTSDLASYQLHNPTSSVPQCSAEDSAHSSQKPIEKPLEKRELRLMKNREAARECRRKKKEYIRCLEQRVVVLENQSKSLMEELRALKDIHKVE
ncbi:cAMP-responsive element modulator-like isoform X3 [Amphiprion ocellaris]|uniref:cAMP-responsive element modulator-like isoform X3 n=1 Tax=Amphiprion ocellaris TaxID=80972 RepID=UPI000C30FF82|nr:cAMP-responsive element modulator-like isoform X3 [Amphiprion ocellaris]